MIPIRQPARARPDATDSSAVGLPPVEAKIENPKSTGQRVLAYRWLWIFALLAFALDQITKVWINHRLPLGSYGVNGVPVIRGFFNIVHVGNTGAAWSMFTGRSSLLAGLALATLAAIFLWRHQLGLRQPTAQTCFGLLCGGTVGNLVDRLVHGHVIDFLDFHFGSYTYPTFNLADAAICSGVIGYILWSLRQPSPAGGNQ
jgi:signal peptidase II